MDVYHAKVMSELQYWQHQMVKNPGLLNTLSKKIQNKINNYLPEKFHKTVTTIIRQMIKGVLFGSKLTTAAPLQNTDLMSREAKIKERIKFYRSTAAVEGGITGAGGLLASLADFPLLLTLKLKLLYEVSALYGFNLNDYKERIYLLHIFELAFSSPQHRKNIFLRMQNWETVKGDLPEDINLFNWRKFQQEYRDYIDVAKMAQLIPVIGAPVGLLVNYRLIKKLGITAMNAYRMRLLTRVQHL